MHALVLAHDWSDTPLGDRMTWPPVLRATVELILASKHGMMLAWGSDLTLFYNDAYAQFLGQKHPLALGRPFAEAWSDIWPDVEPLVEQAWSGEAVWFEDFHLVMERNGYPEDTWWQFSYSPVYDDDGRIAGMLNVTSEMTGKVLVQRRQAFRLALERTLRGLKDPDRIMDAATAALGEHLGVERVGYAEIQPDDATGILSHCYANGVAPLFGHYQLDQFGAEAIARQRQGASEVCDDVLADPNQDPDVWTAIDTRAFVSVPLIRDGRFRASLYVNARDPRRWSAEDIAFIEDVASRTWDAVERARAERTLRENEAQFRGVFNSQLTGLSIFDVNSGRTLAINDTFLAMTGHSRDDFDEGRWEWRDFTLPEYLHLDEAAIVQARERGFCDTYEKEYRRPDGSRFPVRLASAAMPGEPGRVVVSVQDISVARAAEADLRESQQRFLLAQQAAGIGVWDWDLRTDTITWSREMYELLDIDPNTRSDRLFEAWTLAVHPDDRDRAASTASQSAAAGEAFSMDFRTLRRDGEMRWLRSQATAVLDAEGRPARLTGINVDVTAQHLTEEALRGETKKLAAAVEERTRERNRVFELSSELFAAAGFDGYLKTINPAWETLLGYTEAELLNRPFVDLIHPDDHAAAAEVVAAMLSGQSVQVFEDRLLRKDGRVIWIAWTAVPEGDRFYAVGRDVTREREREEALRQSQKMEAMGQLTGGVAHDFNNLLTPIVGALDMLQRKGLGGDREQRLIDGAAQSAERARTLVQRLLAFARRQPLQSVTVDMERLVSGMADLVASTTGPQIKVVVDIGRDLPPAKADPNQLEMAVLNLAVNARDAMPDGGTLRISVEAATVGRQHRSKLKPGRYLNLSVADTGIGMDEATLARAIEPFFSTKGVGKGTGLGLSMVHGLASQLGGALTVRSAPGMGTNIELWLPQGENVAVPAELPAEDHAIPAAAGTVLLVDDEDLVRLSTADMLIDLGYHVIEAATAEEALRLLNRGLNPDIVVTDHLMPGMTGTDLARTLRGEWPSIKTLIVSGYAETAGIAADLPRLTKPFRNVDLASSLAALGKSGRL
jgi:PAS domain S-box-containing protein